MYPLSSDIPLVISLQPLFMKSLVSMELLASALGFCASILPTCTSLSRNLGQLSILIVSFYSKYMLRKLPDEPATGGDNDFWSQVSGIFSSVFGAREGFSRSITILLILAMLMYVATGSADVNYLFTRKMFHWTESEYTRVTTGVTGKLFLYNQLSFIHIIVLFSVLQTLASLFLLPALSYKLGVPDAVIGLVATLSCITTIVGFAVSQNSSHFIIGESELGSTLDGINAFFIDNKCFSECMWHHESPGVHCHPVSALEDGARG